MKFAFFLFGGILLILFAMIVNFFHSEWSRSKLIESYAPPKIIISQFTRTGIHSAADYFEGDDGLLCILDSYGKIDSLNKLSGRQSQSISNDKIPSEDGTWYLLIFNENEISEIYLMDKYGENGIQIQASTCLKGNEKFSISRSATGNQLFLELK